MSHFESTPELAEDLIRKPSVTPEDAGCQTLIAERLAALGFALEPMPFEDVSNLWAIRGSGEPVFVFAGHTDVVPPGPADEWHTEPFTPTRIDGMLHGRGAADMKGSLAAMVTATEAFIADHPDHKGSIAFLITSDEEGPFINGTKRVVEALRDRGQPLTWALVGEPSSTDTLGDIIKIGRRGSLTGYLTVLGIQGHVAYPQFAANAVHQAMPALHALATREWDTGNDFFPATSFQIVSVNAGTATNVIPGQCGAEFNFRYSTETTADELQARVAGLLDSFGLDYRLDWKLNGEPFLTAEGDLLQATRAAIDEETGIQTRELTSGGTSDGRFLAPAGAEVVELGPVNATIHRVNECVRTDDLVTLSRIYCRILRKLLL